MLNIQSFNAIIQKIHSDGFLSSIELTDLKFGDQIGDLQVNDT